MKIIMLNYEFPPIGGGGGRAHLNILNEYSTQKTLSIDVVTSKRSPGIEVEQFSDNIKIHKIGIHKKNLHYWKKLEVVEWLFKAYLYYAKLLQNNTYDMAHAFFGFPTGLLCYLKRKKLPYIISLRGSDVPGKNARLNLDYKILGGLFKNIWQYAEKVVACSEGLKQRAVKFYPDINIDVIPNGVDLIRFQPSSKHISLKNMPLKLITVGRLSATKRVDLLIDTVCALKQLNHSIQLTIIGDGPLCNNLRSMIYKKKLSENIILTGRLEPVKIAELYRQSHLYISATEQEGMSNTMLEALASALPVVTTKCEGVEELLTDRNGIVAEDNPDALASSVLEIITNGENRYTMMCRAAHHQALQFPWKNASDRYIACYRKTITALCKPKHNLT
jgi:glycosyltransferase involved in cell wall biosynthesis